MNKAIVQHMVVIGVGLIGGSLALAARNAGVVGRVTGVGRNPQALQRGVDCGVIDGYCLDPAEAVADADLVVIATPVLTTGKILQALRDALPERAVITDVGSAKQITIDAATQVFGQVPARFVPGHPIAGSERSGIEAAEADLFQQHKVILTPLEDTDKDALACVTTLWQALGAQVIEMPVEDHDQVLAATSHLPHLLAFSLVDSLAGQPSNQDIFRYAAGGFRDFTRIAASDPVMWHDIFLANREAVLASLDHFSADLEKLRDALQQGDSERMLGIFTRAKAARDHFSKQLAHRAYMEASGNTDIRFIAQGGGPIRGDIRVPGDKSISHRSIMLGALAEGVTEIQGFLEGEDSLATLQAFRDMGVVIEGPQQGEVKVHGVGLHGLQKPPGELYLGNSGTAMRLFAGLLAAQAFDSVLTGDDSLSGRPMGRVADPLAEMGARIETREGKPPLRIKGAQPLRGFHYDMPMASAQVKSCLLLAGLYAEGETSVLEPAPTRDHAERMLTGFGYQVSREALSGGASKISLRGGGSLKAGRIDVPSDISSAAFFMVAASIVPGSDLTLRHVGVNPTRIGIINILRQMGADIELLDERLSGGEPVADIRVKYAPLKGIEIPQDQVPLAIDEFPVIFVAAACAEGETVLTGAEELRVKESDRIQVMADGLVALGVDAQATPDGMRIQGGEIGGGSVGSHGDHRIAMAFSVASLRASGAIEIGDCANVATSFPNFVALANQVGLKLELGS